MNENYKINNKKYKGKKKYLNKNKKNDDIEDDISWRCSSSNSTNITSSLARYPIRDYRDKNKIREIREIHPNTSNYKINHIITSSSSSSLSSSSLSSSISSCPITSSSHSSFNKININNNNNNNNNNMNRNKEYFHESKSNSNNNINNNYKTNNNYNNNKNKNNYHNNNNHNNQINHSNYEKKHFNDFNMNNKHGLKFSIELTEYDFEDNHEDEMKYNSNISLDDELEIYLKIVYEKSEAALDLHAKHLAHTAELAKQSATERWLLSRTPEERNQYLQNRNIAPQF